MGGGGYFRLFPLFLTERAIRQVSRECSPAVATLYFHPWEFDPGQPRLPLGRLSGFRTYVGIEHTRRRLARLLGKYSFVRAIDLAKRLELSRHELAAFDLAADTARSPGSVAVP
jgi:hypothetical protein